MQNFAMLLARLALAWVFVVSGIDQLLAYRDTATALATHGIAPGWLPLALAVELAGGLAVATGLFTRTGAALLLVFTVLAATLVNGGFTDQSQWIEYGQNLAIAGGLLLLAVHGAGGWSLDAWRRRRKQRQKIFF